jgi:pseudaminic acid synthase
MGVDTKIGSRIIGSGHSTYIVAELSANHNQRYEDAVRLVTVAKQVGADAVKLQTYTPDTLTIDCKNEYFKVKGTIWKDKYLYELYSKAYMPWEWQPKLKKLANSLGMDLFSTPFDKSSVDFLEEMGVPAYKIASFELVDIPLIEYVNTKNKPIIMSTGMATFDEIGEAVMAVTSPLILLKCVSSYPAKPEEMNLRTIPEMSSTFGCPVGLSDHTLSIEVPIVAVSLGACMIEKHLTISRDNDSPDNQFSLEPDEFKEMVDAVRITEKALGRVSYDISEQEAKTRVFRRSLFVVEDIKKGDFFAAYNVRSIRPGHGLPPRAIEAVLGKHATQDIKRGTPLNWGMIE